MDINAAFKLFDIRGDYPAEVDERLAFIIGKALTLLHRPAKVLVASDTRESSPSLKNFLIDGLSVGSASVFDLYEAPVPEFYYTVATGGYDLGVIVTASHINDLENGFKIVNRNGIPFNEAEIQNVKNLVHQLAGDPVIVPKLEAKRTNNTDNYIAALLKLAPKKKFTSKLVLDVTRSSVVTPVLVLFSRLGINFSFQKSGLKADLGISWDSDGDRVSFTDQFGEPIPSSFVLGALAAGEISNSKGKKVIADVRAGLVVRDLVEEVGGTLEILPTWSQFIKFAMQEDPDICFGGETSGHFVFRDFHCIDDGILAALKFLTLWEETDLQNKIKVLSKKYFELPEQNFPCKPDRAPVILEELSEYYRSKEYPVSIKDGLTVFGPDFKFNLRSSVIQPFLRLNLETKSQKRSEEIVHELEKHLVV